MGMKVIKKKDCKFVEGHIVRKNKVVGIPTNVWLQLNKLETIVQEHAYLKKQKPYSPGPSLDGFVRQSALSANTDDVFRAYVPEPKTPNLDEIMEKAMSVMEEADKVSDYHEIHDAIDEYKELIAWLASKKFIEGTCYEPIDLKFIVNPLILEPEGVVHFIKHIVENPIYMAPKED